MKQAELIRVTSGPDGTFGVFVFNGRPLCVTCEDPWKNNANYISCIPDGKYRVVKFSGTKYKNVWEITKVPKRSAILMHQGNIPEDTQGCVLMGGSFGLVNYKPAIIESKKTMAILRAILPDGFDLVVTGLNFVVK